jgi:asparagine synthase (glutamine-hydrolysing)
MPGIAGILNRHDPSYQIQRRDAMLRSMMHETFYTKACHTDQELGWYVGSVAIKDSFADCMPVSNEAHDVVLFMAGECVEDPRTEGPVGRKGHESKPNNAMSILKHYEEEGPGFIKKLNGLFCGVILDRKHGETILFNDRYGLQRIYYYKAKNGFYFASEAKALLKIIPELRTLELQSVAEYICFDCVLNNRTYFPNIYLLPAGSVWIFKGENINRKRYFDFSELETQSPLEPEQFLEELAETFKSILPRYLIGDGVGFDLTGGQDTRLIAACLPDQFHQLKSITFGSMYRDSRDVRIGKKVSDLCGLEHHALRINKEFLNNYSRHFARAIFISDGMIDATNADTIYLNNLARDFTPVRITGKFGSQVLGRVKRALRNRLPNPSLIHQDFNHHIFSVSDSLVQFKNERNLTFVLSKEIPWYWARYTIPEMSQLIVRTPFIDNDLISLLYRAPREGFDGSAFELDTINKKNSELLAVQTNRWLHKTIGFAEKVFNWDVLPYSLHHAVARIDCFLLTPLNLDKLLLGTEYRRHYNKWFRHELSSYLKETLLDNRTLSRPYWNGKYLSQIVNDHVSGRGNYLSEIRKVLTIELIHRTLVENVD